MVCGVFTEQGCEALDGLIEGDGVGGHDHEAVGIEVGAQQVGHRQRLQHAAEVRLLGPVNVLINTQHTHNKTVQRWRLESTYKGLLDESNESSEPPKLNSHYSLESDQRWRLESDQRWRLRVPTKGF
jgi:hypothetical protein